MKRIPMLNLIWRIQSECKIPEEMAKEQNENFTLEEISAALKQLKNGKVPGLDGLPVEIYKCFWAKLGPIFVEMLNAAYQQGKAGKVIINWNY